MRTFAKNMERDTSGGKNAETGGGDEVGWGGGCGDEVGEKVFTMFGKKCLPCALLL